MPPYPAPIRVLEELLQQFTGLIIPDRKPPALFLSTGEALPFLISARSANKCVSQTQGIHSLAFIACIAAPFRGFPHNTGSVGGLVL